MPRYANQTTVNKDRSISEIERTVARYGATGFIYGWSGEMAMIGFVIGNRQIRLQLPMPDRADAAFVRTPTGKPRAAAASQDAYDQAVRQRWRALALYVKATLEAAESGIIRIEDAFLAYTALPNGATVGQLLSPQMDNALLTGTLPRLLPGT